MTNQDVAGALGLLALVAFTGGVAGFYAGAWYGSRRYVDAVTDHSIRLAVLMRGRFVEGMDRALERGRERGKVLRIPGLLYDTNEPPLEEEET